MLDQNTDRMWFVIGAVIVGAAIIFIANGTLPTLFASVSESFEEATTKGTSVIDEIRFDDRITKNFEVMGDTKVVNSSFVHTTSFQVGENTITLDVPLRSANNSARDRVFLDTDGKWKIERKTGIVKFGRDLHMTSNGSIYFQRISNKAYSSDYQTTHLGSGGSTPWLQTARGNYQLVETVERSKPNYQTYVLAAFHPDFTVYPTVDIWNSWLDSQEDQGTPFEIVYELTTPYIEILPNSTQQVLNNQLKE